MATEEEMERPWFNFYEKEAPRHIEYPDIPLYKLLDDAAEKYPDSTALVFFGKRIRYQQLQRYVSSLATALKKLGISKGDRVAICLPNCPQFVIGFYAILKLGGIVVQTNALYVERELEQILNNSRATTIIVLDLLYPRIERVREKTSLKDVIVTSIKDFLPFPLNLLYPLKVAREGQKVKLPQRDGVKYLGDLLRTESEAIEVEVNPKEDLAILQYTGGTTGVPKGVMLTHFNLVANTFQSGSWFTDAQPGEEVLLAAIPFFHVYGMTTCMNLGIKLASSVLLVPKFEVKQILKLIHKERPTIFPGVPTMYVAINNYPEVRKYNLRSIRACISGSAALPVKVKEDFEALSGGNLVEGYGLSEASPVTHANPIKGTNKPGSMGLPFPDTDAKIVDLETGEKALATDEIGELVIKGPEVMKGYWELPEETKKTVRNGWLHTGDIAKVDKDGYFFIVDRKKEMIICSGFNVYPRDVEEVLYRHPKVKEAAVIGVPSEYRGETVKAFIVPKEGETATEEEIKNYCKENLAGYKVPEFVEFRDSLPKSMIGKVLKRVLVEEEKSAH